MPDDAPDLDINRLAKGAADAARKEAGRAPADVVDAAVRTALRATIFRFELVMRINVVSHEMIDREVLIHAAFAGQLAMLLSDDRTEHLADPDYLGRIAQCRDLTLIRVTELMAEEEARSTAEDRYLSGHPALFPDDVDKWAGQLHLSQEQAVIADRVAELDGLPPAASMNPDHVAKRIAVLASDLTEPARANALEKLDEGHHAHGIATSWLRSKVTGLPVVPGTDASPRVATA